MSMLLHRHRAAKNITTSEDLKPSPETGDPKQVNPEQPSPETGDPKQVNPEQPSPETGEPTDERVYRKK